jgi:hypothetical protein
VKGVHQGVCKVLNEILKRQCPNIIYIHVNIYDNIYIYIYIYLYLYLYHIYIYTHEVTIADVWRLKKGDSRVEGITADRNKKKTRKHENFEWRAFFNAYESAGKKVIRKRQHMVT